MFPNIKVIGIDIFLIKLKFFKLLNSTFELKKYNMVIKTPIFITKIILLLTSKTLKLNIIKNTNITTTKYPITPLLSK
jgi:hypothetical protein